MGIDARYQAEEQLIAELGLVANDDPPCVGGHNFNINKLWDALVKERMKNNRLEPRRIYEGFID